jgi:transposase
VYRDMEQWTEIRHRVLVEGVSKREVLRETGMHWTTLEKILSHGAPPGYRQKRARSKPKIGPHLARIAAILESDKSVPKKQRHTAKRIFHRLREEEIYTGGYTAVKEAVRELRHRTQEVFMPLVHRPGEAQVDFGFALARVAGDLRKIAFLVMALPYSDAVFVAAFERECTETFWEGHVRAFRFFGGVPVRITYDNSRVAVSKILEGRGRRLTRGFLELKSHYLFDHHFCHVRRANEKGVVEGLVGFTRRNFLVPVPQVGSLEALNRDLEERCREDLKRRLRGKSGSKAQLLEEERGALLSLPAGRFDACRKVSTTASSLSLVRFDGNDYSVPVRWAHHPVVVKGYVERVEICHKDKQVALHGRLWDKEGVRFDPLHYLALLERKPGALDHARALEGWSLPECFGVLRRRLENALGGQGTREYIRVLRLLEKHPLKRLTQAVEKSLNVGALTRDAIAQFLWPRQEWRRTSFCLDGREHLRLVRVGKTDIVGYGQLLSAGGAR